MCPFTVLVIKYFYFLGSEKSLYILQVARSCCPLCSKGWGRIYFGLAGTDCQIFITPLTELFGKPGLLDPEQVLDTPVQKKRRMKATQAEEQDAAATSERNLEQETLLVYTPKLPVPGDLGIEKDLLPTAC